ncbi:chemotaxis protein CheW [Halobacteriovorax sp. GB3]|uniref:chemotaxis protein CheW n=1 Tax=Halobacteriovorax sp. GB3 TaxID=2719615 RepID=UPI00235F78A3|nr:chemotaxis protein CheW [Halobacteriovorax sp. GB3]MDD0854199.1 chemotaxis protein CheW [Halobacteriovorax sp. GB3]
MNSNYKIVCVDDEVEILSIYETALGDLPYEIVTFSDPNEASDYVAVHANDIVFIYSDFSMPQMDGFEFREKVLEAGGDIPFALVTGYYNKEMATRGMKLKIISFVEKPFNSDKLIELANESIPARQASLEEENEMIRSFVEESFPMLEEIEDLILILEDDPEDVVALNTYFRLLHTIKGTSSCVGLKTVPAYTHKYEDLVGKLKSGEQKVNKLVIDVLLAGLDELKTMYDSISSGAGSEFDIEEKIKIFDRDFTSTEAVAEKAIKKQSVGEAQKAPTQDEEKINVLVSILDNFMELSGELTVLRNMILKSATKIESKYMGDRDVDVLNESLEEMHKVSSKLQVEISEMRKVSLENVFRPMKRVVRDASKNLGKEIEFFTKGEALKVDTSIGKVLNNALVHLIRNGIDHGIETPEARLEKGKSQTGHLELNAYEEGENIVVEIVDDGNGLDPEKIKEKALEKGLYEYDELERMSKHRVYNLIFEPGFSTAQVVTDISGRGVGMDMVKSSVVDAGGKILIDSEKGKGSKFVLILPIPRSVLIMKALMVESADQHFSVPLDNIAEVVNFGKAKEMSKVQNMEGSLVLRHHEEIIPLVDLSKTLGLSDESNLRNENEIVILTGEGLKFGIIVENVLDIEEVVVKKLVHQLKNCIAFMGTTLVGDGDLALILDPNGLAELNEISIDVEDESLEYKRFETEQAVVNEEEYMQFNLFSRENFCISLDDVFRLEEIEASRISYSGELAILRYREKFLPIIHPETLLGFSPTSVQEVVENDDILNLLVIEKNEKQYGILVSKINDIGKSDQELHDNTIDREGIKGTIYINEKTVTVLDTEYLVANYKKISVSKEVEQYEERLSRAS